MGANHICLQFHSSYWQQFKRRKCTLPSWSLHKRHLWLWPLKRSIKGKIIMCKIVEFPLKKDERRGSQYWKQSYNKAKLRVLWVSLHHYPRIDFYPIFILVLYFTASNTWFSHIIEKNYLILICRKIKGNVGI